MIILGIDPGTATTGYGVIKKIKTRKGFKVLDCGCILTSPKSSTGDRLKKINNELSKLITKHRPNILAVENIYFARNLKTAVPVSQAKGVILLTAAKKRLLVYEFSPLQMKMTITGYGWAQKDTVQKKIKRILKLKEIPKPDDVADALGIALCGAFENDKRKKSS